MLAYNHKPNESNLNWAKTFLDKTRNQNRKSQRLHLHLGRSKQDVAPLDQHDFLLQIHSFPTQHNRNRNDLVHRLKQNKPRRANQRREVPIVHNGSQAGRSALALRCLAKSEAIEAEPNADLPKREANAWNLHCQAVLGGSWLSRESQFVWVYDRDSAGENSAT